MYNIYTTHGIIIKAKPTGEADKILSVFTKSFGRVELYVKGARNITSKLRPHLELYCYLRVSFVAGKDFFRLTDAENFCLFDKTRENGAKFGIFARTLNFLEKMLQGQEKNEELWNALINSFVYLNELHDGSEKNLNKTLENILVLKILYFLGYIGDDKNFVSDIINNKNLSPDTLQKYVLFDKEISKLINTGLKESGLVIL